MTHRSIKYKITIEHTCTACAINGVDEEIDCEVCQGMVHHHESHTIPEEMVNSIKADGVREAVEAQRYVSPPVPERATPEAVAAAFVEGFQGGSSNRYGGNAWHDLDITIRGDLIKGIAHLIKAERNE